MSSNNRLRERVWSLAEAARVLRVRTSKVRQWVRLGEVKLVGGGVDLQGLFKLWCVAALVHAGVGAARAFRMLRNEFAERCPTEAANSHIVGFVYSQLGRELKSGLGEAVLQPFQDWEEVGWAQRYATVGVVVPVRTLAQMLLAELGKFKGGA
jgi:hypothetical protein